MPELETVCIMALRQKMAEVRGVVIQPVIGGIGRGNWEVVNIFPPPGLEVFQEAMLTIRELHHAFALRIVN